MAKDKGTPAKRETAPARLDTPMAHWFDEFFNRPWPRLRDLPALESLEAATPRVDVIDRDDTVVVRAELPGIDKDDIELSVSGNTLTLKGSSRQEEQHEDGDYHRREIVSRYVSRTVTLPCDVDGDKANARLKNGMLEVTLPKLEQAGRKKISVES
jgi:HSP20 family protein